MFWTHIYLQYNVTGLIYQNWSYFSFYLKVLLYLALRFVFILVILLIEYNLVLQELFFK